MEGSRRSILRASIQPQVPTIADASPGRTLVDGGELLKRTSRVSCLTGSQLRTRAAASSQLPQSMSEERREGKKEGRKEILA